MAITLTDDALRDALRLGDTTEETAEAARLKAYASAVVTQYLGAAFADVPAEIVNEAVVRLAAFLFDAGHEAPDALKRSGAGAVLFPYKVVRATSTGEAVQAASTALTPSGQPVDVGNPVDNVTVDLTATPAEIVVTFRDGTIQRHDLPDVDEASEARNRQIDRRIASWARANSPTGTISRARIGANKIGQTELAEDSVGGREIQADAVAAGHIADDAIETAHIGSNQIIARHIPANTITEALLAAEVVSQLGGGTSAAPYNPSRGYRPGEIVLVGVTNAYIAVRSSTGQTPATSPLDWQEITPQPDPQAYGPFRGVVASRNPATIETDVPGERDGDIVVGYDRNTVGVFRFATNGNRWTEQVAWPRAGKTDAELEAFIERIVSAWSIAGSADGIPGAKTFDGLFRSESQTPIPAANTRIAFDVGDSSTANAVDETDAEDTSFNITSEQAAEADAFIRVRYQVGGAQVNARPTDVELLLQVRDTGAVIGRHNLPLGLDQTEGTATFPVGDAGAKRWAIRVVTKGNYKGEVRITEATYHSAQSLADPAIEHVVHPIVSREAEERQTEDARLQADIARVEGIKAIVNGLPAATATVKKTVKFRTDRPYQQTDDDAFQIPATGFVAFVLGNFGTTAIMPVELCRNRQEIVYAAGRNEVGLAFSATGKAALYARTSTALYAAHADAYNTTQGFVMLHWAPARASGHATSELADLETRVEKLEAAGGASISRHNIAFPASSYSYDGSTYATWTAPYPEGTDQDFFAATMKTAYLVHDGSVNADGTVMAEEGPSTLVGRGPISPQISIVTFTAAAITLEIGTTKALPANQRDGWRVRVTAIG